MVKERLKYKFWGKSPTNEKCDVCYIVNRNVVNAYTLQCNTCYEMMNVVYCNKCFMKGSEKDYIRNHMKERHYAVDLI